MDQWKGSWTFEDYIFSLFDRKLTQSDEFQTMLRIYGKEKMSKLWEKYKTRPEKQIQRIGSFCARSVLDD